MKNPIDTIEIQARYCGPPDSGNGGYVSGRLAEYIEGPAQVTLRKPPPLERPLQIVRDGDAVGCWDGELLIAEARPAPALEGELPEPPSLEQAAASSKSYVGFRHHVFPRCFVCGPEREPDDGLCIYPGEDASRGLVAAPWTPDASLEGDEGLVAPRYLWAAMDCPGAFAVGLDEDRLVVLGRLTAAIYQPLALGEACVVAGWPLGEEGRKFFAGTAIFDSTGGLICQARAVWIAIPPSSFGAVTKPA